MVRVKAVAIDHESGSWGGAGKGGIQIILQEGFGDKNNRYEWCLSTYDAAEVSAKIAAAVGGSV